MLGKRVIRSLFVVSVEPCFLVDQRVEIQGLLAAAVGSCLNLNIPTTENIAMQQKTKKNPV